ncbi:hypothetical protein HD806DRAFT_525360 [Xylariaceae sp. AK1471]|nr:hypothetical protein HD806DRAFT_525360 [Xylariaceae sp. AK1471]
MPFTPDPTDVEEYETAAKNSCWFSLGSLPARQSQSAIEAAIRRTPNCAGNVVVYWPDLPRTAPYQQHRGWCHIVCPDGPTTAVVQSHLNDLQVAPNSQLAVVRETHRLIPAFERITRILQESAPDKTQATPDRRQSQASITTQPPDAPKQEPLPNQAPAISDESIAIDTTDPADTTVPLDDALTDKAEVEEKTTSEEEVDYEYTKASAVLEVRIIVKIIPPLHARRLQD